MLEFRTHLLKNDKMNVYHLCKKSKIQDCTIKIAISDRSTIN